MRGENRISAFWDKCFAEEVFVQLEKQADEEDFIFGFKRKTNKDSNKR